MSFIFTVSGDEPFSEMYQLEKKKIKLLVFLVTCLFTVPSFIQPIQNKTAEEGENVTVSCNASGTSPLMVSWIKVDGGERFDGSELVLNHINRSQAGEYMCEASNLCENASETATIVVQCKYQFLVLKSRFL